LTTGGVRGAGAMKWLRLYSDCVVRVRTDCYPGQLEPRDDRAQYLRGAAASE